MNKNTKTLLSVIYIIIGMFCLAYACVPLYNIFCKATGYGGTTQKAVLQSTIKGQRKITVRFDANIDSSLKWEFEPVQNQIDVITGENVLVFYRAKNLLDKPIIGTAVYNVTPTKAGIYFNKIQCFCFEEQLLLPGEDVLMPVSFFIDPKLEEDSTLDDVTTITLSYSFFKVKNQNLVKNLLK